jgi:hypothetical protein
MSQGPFDIRRRIDIHVFEKDFRADIRYEVLDPDTGLAFGVVEVKSLFENEPNPTVDEIRAKAAERAKYLLSLLVSHLQSNP